MLKSLRNRTATKIVIRSIWNKGYHNLIKNVNNIHCVFALMSGKNQFCK